MVWGLGVRGSRALGLIHEKMTSGRKMANIPRDFRFYMQSPHP